MDREDKTDVYQPDVIIDISEDTEELCRIHCGVPCLADGVQYVIQLLPSVAFRYTGGDERALWLLEYDLYKKCQDPEDGTTTLEPVRVNSPRGADAPYYDFLIGGRVKRTFLNTIDNVTKYVQLAAVVLHRDGPDGLTRFNQDFIEDPKKILDGQSSRSPDGE